MVREDKSIHNSWWIIIPQATAFGILFDSKLFKISAELKFYFKSDMVSLSDKFTSAIAVITDKTLGWIFVFGMAARHMEYGAKPEHYRMDGKKLLWNLENGLGENWNEDINKTCTDVYQMLTDALIRF